MWVYDSRMKRFLSISVLSLTIIWPFQAVAYDEAQLTRFKAIKKCRSCDLSSANLSGWRLYGADLRGANLHGANLKGARISNADLSNSDLTDANLEHAVFGGLTNETDLSNADLTGANIEGADFQHAIFCNTKTPWGLENIGCE